MTSPRIHLPDPADTPKAPDHVTGNNARASWNFSADAVNQNTSHYSADARELLRWCFHFCINPRHSLSRAEFARRVGYSDNVIFKIFTGSYRHPTTGEQLDVPEKLMHAMRQFRKVETERSMLGNKGFVITPSVRRAWNLCDLCRESQTPGFLYGASQIGKTAALEQYALRNNHGGTAYVRMGAASGMHGMLRLIAEAVGVSPKSEAKKLVDRIKKAITPNMLIILDEVHLLIYTYRREAFFACMEVLREIYDCTKCGMVFCMTNLGKTKVERERGNELEQIFRRGVHRVELGSMPTERDLGSIFTDVGLAYPDKHLSVDAAGVSDKPYAIIRQLAREEGLTAIMERLRYARKLSHIAKEDLAWEYFVEAHYLILAQSTPPQPW